MKIESSKLFPNSEISKKDFSIKFATDLVPHYSVSIEVPPRIHRGNPPTVTVSVKRIQGKKYATEIRGLNKYLLNESQIAKTLSNNFSVSCSKTTDNGIYCQGNLGDRVKGWLVDVIGIPRECIVVSVPR